MWCVLKTRGCSYVVYIHFHGRYALSSSIPARRRDHLDTQYGIDVHSQRCNMPHMFIIHMVYYASIFIIDRTKQEFNLKYRESEFHFRSAEYLEPMVAEHAHQGRKDLVAALPSVEHVGGPHRFAIALYHIRGRPKPWMVSVKTFST